jgi:low temperature requirement protein LtrA
MTSPGQSVERDAVSPLELFFDLVFVFAVSQLSHHLLDHLSCRTRMSIIW